MASQGAGAAGRSRRVRVLAGLAVVAAALTPGAGAALAASPSTGQKVTFTVGITNDIDSFNPYTGILAEAYEAYQLMYDYLTSTSDKDFSPVPGLAESWTESPDGKTWTYKIRSGVKWSDGKPLTARDVAYSFNRVIKGDYEQTNYGNYVANITSVTAPDDTTVVMSTSKPSPIMLRLAVPIVPEHVWSAISQKQVKSFANEQSAVGSGPFVLAERKTGQFARFVANKDYWAGAPKIDELVFRVYSNQDALAQALKKGEIDFADNVDADPWQSLKDTPGVTAYAGGVLRLQRARLQHRRRPGRRHPDRRRPSGAEGQAGPGRAELRGRPGGPACTGC